MENPDIQRLIQLLSRLPGLGPRSGRRATLHLMKHKAAHMAPLMDALQTAHDLVTTCTVCGNLDALSPCTICRGTKREASVLCLVSDVEDVWAMERAGIFKGVYHILGGVLSAIDGIGPQQLNLQNLHKRLKDGTIKEVIIALSATLEGQTTAHYVSDLIKETGVQVTRIAHGIPMGGELDYLDEGTIAAALKARTPL